MYQWIKSCTLVAFVVVLTLSSSGAFAQTRQVSVPISCTVMAPMAISFETTSSAPNIPIMSAAGSAWNMATQSEMTVDASGASQRLISITAI